MTALSYGQVPQGCSLFKASGGAVVQGYLVIVVGLAAHQLGESGQGCLAIIYKVLLIEAAEVEAVYGQGVVYQAQGLIPPTHHAQDGGLEGASLVVVPVADERAVNLLQGIVQAALHSGNAGASEVARILPGGIPA